MITQIDRKRLDAVVTRLGSGDTQLQQEFREWLEHPMTRTLLVALETEREQSIVAQSTAYGATPILERMQIIGSQAVVWDQIFTLLTSFPEYAAEIAKEKAPVGNLEDAAARPPDL
jgi:hypothetical protein